MVQGNISKCHVRNKGSWQSGDYYRRGNISRHVFYRPLILVTGIWLCRGNLRFNIFYTDIIQSSFFACNTFTDPHEDRMATVYYLQAIGFHIFNKTAIYRFKCNSGTVSIEHFDIDQPDMPKATAGCSTEFDPVGTGTNSAILYQHILANGIGIMGFQTNPIISRVDVCVGYRHAVAIHDIETVIVPECTAVNIDTVDIYILALVICLNPGRPITNGYSPDDNIFAGLKINHHWSYLDFRPVISKSVFNKSFMNQFSYISRHLSPLPIDDSLPRNGYVLLVMRMYQCSKINPVVIQWIQYPE